LGARCRAAFDHELALAITSIAARAIDARYRRLARKAGPREPRGGSVIVMQRFSSDLRTNLHLHGLFLDGAYGEDARAIHRFARAPAPSPLEVEQVLANIVANARAWLEERDAEAALEDEELALAQSHIVSCRASGAPAHGPDDAPREHRRLVLLRRKARIDGFDLDAEVPPTQIGMPHTLRATLSGQQLDVEIDDVSVWSGSLITTSTPEGAPFSGDSGWRTDNAVIDMQLAGVTSYDVRCP
jgi:hypothetical protein